MHFSITPRMRTVTSGLNIIRSTSEWFQSAGSGKTQARLGIFVVPGILAVPVQIIESPHFVGAVVAAISRSHAAVVNHYVQPFGVVHRRAHGANLFARSVFALLAGKGLKHHFGVWVFASPLKYRSIRIQCICRFLSTWSLPTIGMLFSAWQATTHAWHPMHLTSRSPCPIYGYR